MRFALWPARAERQEDAAAEPVSEAAPQPLPYFPGDMSHLNGGGPYYFGAPQGFDLGMQPVQPLAGLPPYMPHMPLPAFPMAAPEPEDEPAPLPAPPRTDAASPFRHLAAWATLCAGFIALMLAAIFYYYSLILPDPRAAALAKTPPNVRILAANGAFIAERGMRRDYVTHDRLPRVLIDAVISTEDRRFPYHFGFDPSGLARAYLKNRERGEIVQGGSTLTQQLAKILFLERKRTMRRKIEELFIALWLEWKFSKDEILELYLNRVYFGSGNYGIGAAAYHYFNKRTEDLALPEAALLVGLIKAPSYLSPRANRSEADERTGIVLTNMLNAGFIDDKAYRKALASPAVISRPEPPLPGFEYVIDWVSETVPALVGDARSNLIVETSLDFDLQRKTDAIVRSVMEGKGKPARAGQAAVVMLTPDGGVKALFGGMDYARSQFNRAVKALRQPASSFKPFIYLAALEAGLTPDSLVEDKPVKVAGWTPANSGSSYRGRIPLKTALAQSSNAAAVRLMQYAGTSKVIGAAHRLGITSRLDVGPTLALGTAEITLLEMTAAYASFANEGMGVLPYIITRIRNDKGRVLFKRKVNGDRRVMPARVAGHMNEMLSAVVTSGTGTAAALSGRPAAGKTGTSSGYRDAWFIGYTADYVAGVWLGNDRRARMRFVTGGSLPASIWRQIMESAHEGLPVRALPGTRGMIAGRGPVHTLSATDPRAFSHPAHSRGRRRAAH